MLHLSPTAYKHFFFLVLFDVMYPGAAEAHTDLCTKGTECKVENGFPVSQSQQQLVMHKYLPFQMPRVKAPLATEDGWDK